MIDYEKIRLFDYKKSFNLARVKKALEIIGNPEKYIKIIHLAGTKGKTSTSFYLKDLIIKNLRLNVGLFISPHIKSPTERITINFKEIETKKMDKLFNYVKNISEKNNLNLTYFEIMTIIAIKYFKEEKVDFAILETGLGGRLDATNVINPVLSIITRIDKDHTNILGKSIFKIAYEKLGIIKKDIPFIIGKQKIYIYFYILFYLILKKLYKNLRNPRIKIKKTNYAIEFYNKNFRIKYNGPYFGIENFLLALKSFVSLFGNNNIIIKDYTHDIKGRFETYKLNNKHEIIFDGAHNKISIKKLVQSIRKKYNNLSFITIFNCQKDKDYKRMLKNLKKITKIFIIPNIENMATEEIIEFLSKKKIKFLLIDKNSFEPEIENYLITGSFYILEEFKNKFLEKFKINP
ncbi:MAG TPA: cyanophycin synthetase [Spirochaetota bacterium]|mgnify:CR=1 FL=1|nr:cyanophycin synthetase [Spirochaetota bacterium]HOM37897.1 cyanophycin synthetase [Spirochaetota bacterium]HPQ48701.1 cyanophycin synthetase [Spirochaetota bacterium]